jgi:hypothetical protein
MVDVRTLVLNMTFKKQQVQYSPCFFHTNLLERVRLCKTECFLELFYVIRRHFFKKEKVKSEFSIKSEPRKLFVTGRGIVHSLNKLFEIPLKYLENI